MEVSNQHVKYNRPCLEACLRRLRYVIEDLEEARLQVNGNLFLLMNIPSF